jgi:hypothetical protein
VVFEKAEGEKCQRCWKILPDVGIALAWPPVTVPFETRLAAYRPLSACGTLSRPPGNRDHEAPLRLDPDLLSWYMEATMRRLTAPYGGSDPPDPAGQACQYPSRWGGLIASFSAADMRPFIERKLAIIAPCHDNRAFEARLAAALAADDSVALMALWDAQPDASRRVFMRAIWPEIAVYGAAAGHRDLVAAVLDDPAIQEEEDCFGQIPHCLARLVARTQVHHGDLGAALTTLDRITDPAARPIALMEIGLRAKDEALIGRAIAGAYDLGDPVTRAATFAKLAALAQYEADLWRHADRG